MRHMNRIQVGLLLTFLCSFATDTAWSQELCGIDSIFYNGFQSATTGNPAAASTPGAILSPGIAVSITGSVSISTTYPSNGSTINGNSTEVAGTFIGPTNSGIAINGVVAVTDGGKFLATVPVQPGANTVNVVARTITGSTSTTSLSLTGAAAGPVGLAVARPSAYAPFLVRFLPTVGALPGSATVSTLSLDYDGDGVDDITNPTPGAPLTYLANTPALYTARLTVVDSTNNTYVAYARYLVQSFPRQSGMLCDVYSYLKDRLTAQDSSAALNALDPNTRPEFQSLFTGNTASLAAYVATLGNIVDGYVNGRSATLIVVRQNPDLTLSGYHMEYTQGADGTWRISGM